VKGQSVERGTGRLLLVRFDCVPDSTGRTVSRENAELGPTGF
jgi:hypothetical protein